MVGRLQDHGDVILTEAPSADAPNASPEDRAKSGKTYTLKVTSAERSDVAPSHTQSYIESLFSNPRILEPTISSMCGFKFSQAVGSTYFAGKKAVSHIPALAGVATPVALLLASASGVITSYSRFPSIRKKMSDDGSSKTQLSTDDLDTTALIFYRGVTFCSYISSVCVALSAYLGGQVFLTGFTASILRATLPAALVPTGIGFAAPIVYGGMTAVSSWYSFYAFSIDKARFFGVNQGKEFSKWLADPSFSINKEMIFTLCICIPVILSSAIGGRFFVEHALRLLVTNLGLQDTISSSFIVTMSMLSMIPNVITNISTKAFSVYKMINPDKADRELHEEHAKVVSAMGYSLEDISLAVFSLFEIIGCGLGGWESGNSLCRKFFGVEPTRMHDLQYALWNVPIIILAACEASQQYAFTIRDMFTSRARARMQTEQAIQTNRDLVETKRTKFDKKPYRQSELLESFSGPAIPSTRKKLAGSTNKPPWPASNHVQSTLSHMPTAAPAV